ncbi:DUF3817 domain-containing protein [Viridibacillus sp. FSL E2-0187]|uniref:DUF3817 domain-containing protein n=1 Tax=Viridibacillus TaxID=496496 RepID=UPI00187B574E|nr:DUF3817 domain-containing protein [Viridibacillus sp. JNUCC-6]QOV11350.1 DUF3817 domain-containing protein [Viridibacillus sp. JNUCC-6]
MLKNPVGQLRLAGYFDGISLLILLLIAMPMKYMLDIPMAVRIAGAAHGFIFVAYVLVILYVTIRVRWNVIWSLLAFVVAFIPFGNFIYDIKLKKLEQRY